MTDILAPTLADPPAAPDSVSRDIRAREWPALRVVTACAALHLASAALIYRDVIRDLYALFDATPRLLVLEQGLARLTATVVFLPPVVPTVLVLVTLGWLGAARRERDVARWLSLAAVPLAADSVLRAIGTLLAPPPATVGELLDLPARFSPGPRLVADLLGLHVRGGTMYWLVVCSAAAGAVVCCVARALLAAEEAALEPVERRRRRRLGDPIAVVQAATIATGAFFALAFLGQLALPPVTQLFLRLLG